MSVYMFHYRPEDAGRAPDDVTPTVAPPLWYVARKEGDGYVFRSQILHIEIQCL